MILPDTNLLVFAYNEMAPNHRRARKWWEDLLSEDVLVGIPWAVTLGFIRLMTPRQVLVEPVDVETCCNIVQEWYQRPQVRPLVPGTRYFSLFRNFLIRIGTGGNLVTDAHLAALAVEHSCELHCNDSDFSRFPGLKWVNPLF